MRRLLSLAMIVALGGCVTTTGAYAPRSAFPLDQDIAEFHTQFASASSVAAYYTQLETVDRRNSFIAGRLTLSNLEYIRFATGFGLTRAQESAAFDLVTLGLGLATTIAGGEHTKTVLGAITTAFAGTRTSYEKNFYDDKTASALVTQMNAERKVALIPILAGSKSSVADYPLTTAIVDLANYEFAGTIAGALQGVQRDAGVKDVKASAIIDQYRTVGFAPDDSTTRINAWLYPGLVRFDATGNAIDANGAVIPRQQNRVAALHAELKTLGLEGLPLGTFLVSAKFTAERSRALNDLKIP